MTDKLAPFDASDYLDDEEVMAEYLAACLEDPNPDVFLAALADVAKAKGMAQVAKASGLGRESLYKALAPSYQEKTSLLVLISAVRKKLASEGITFEAVDVWGWRVERHCRAAAQTFLEAAP